MIDVGERYPAFVQAIVDRVVRKLPGREWHRTLAVLDLREALLLRGRDDGAVTDEACRRIVERSIDAERLHRRPRHALACTTRSLSRRTTPRLVAIVVSPVTASTIAAGVTPVRQR